MAKIVIVLCDAFFNLLQEKVDIRHITGDLLELVCRFLAGAIELPRKCGRRGKVGNAEAEAHMQRMRMFCFKNRLGEARRQKDERETRQNNYNMIVS
jgi:hypothetical protein